MKLEPSIYFPITCFNIVFPKSCIRAQNKITYVRVLRVLSILLWFTVCTLSGILIHQSHLSSSLLCAYIQNYKKIKESHDKIRLNVHSMPLDGSCAHSPHSIYLLIWHLNHIIVQKRTIFSAQIEHIIQYSIQ